MKVFICILILCLIEVKSFRSDRTEALNSQNHRQDLDKMYEMHRILENTDIFNKSLTNFRNSVKIKVNIPFHLLDILNYLKLNNLRVSLRRYTFIDELVDNYMYQKSFPITVINQTYINVTQMCEHHDDDGNYSIAYCYESSGDRLIIKSLSFKSSVGQHFVICIKFFNLENNFEFLIGNMCFDCSFENENQNFKYKPQFIILMYFVCASILVPVIIWQHFIKKAKEKRVAIMKTKMKEMDRNNTQTREFLMPLLFKYEAQSIENFLTPVIDEARHILDAKPWKKFNSESSSGASSNIFSESKMLDDFYLNDNLRRRSSLPLEQRMNKFENGNEQSEEVSSFKSIGFSNSDAETVKMLSNSTENIQKKIRIILNDEHNNGVVLYESNV